MIVFEISNDKFKRILNDKGLFLPLYWNGEDFSVTLSNHLGHYYKSVVRELPTENTEKNTGIRSRSRLKAAPTAIPRAFLPDPGRDPVLRTGISRRSRNIRAASRPREEG